MDADKYDLREHLELAGKISDELNDFAEKCAFVFEESFREITAGFESRLREAGTVALPDRQFSFARIRRERYKLEKRLNNEIETWKAHFIGEREEWLKDLELSAFQFRTAFLCLATIRQIRIKIHENIYPQLNEAQAIIGKSIRKFGALAAADKTGICTAIQSEDRELHQQLGREKLPRVMDAVMQANLEPVYQSYLNGVKKAAEQVAETHLIFKLRDLDSLPPRSRTDKVPLKALVLSEIYPFLAERHRGYAGEIRELIQQVLRNVSELDQIIELNLAAALNFITENEGTEASKKGRLMVIEGLGRAESHIEEMKGLIQKALELAGSGLQKMTLELEGKIQELSDSEKVLELKIRLARARAREEFRQSRRKLWNNAKSSLRYILSAGVGAWRKIRSEYLRIRKVTGLKPITGTLDERLSQYLTESQEKIAGLPYVYQRLFRLDPLTDSRFFAGRLEELESLSKDFERWNNGANMSLALTGERGSGKTTLLNFAEARIFQGVPVVKIVLERTIIREDELLEILRNSFNQARAGNLDELESILLDNPVRCICILENLHELFLRTVDGFAALERFLLLVSRTQKNIFWIVTSALYGWQYLDKILQVSKYFNRVLLMGTQSREELSGIILKRHRVSGYNFEVEITEEFKNSRKYRKLGSDNARRAYLENQLFERLAALAAGNIRVAMLFWLASIKEISRENLVLISKIEFDHAFLYQLPAKELFTLGAMIQHEIMDAREHALIFHQEISESHLLLNRMFNRGFLQKSPAGFMIHPFLYRPVVKALKSKNILH
ncbi:MAG: ATP-binding protein [Candidatus Glassbacteria bacterium]